MNEPINGYCRNIEVGDLQDCHKIIDGRCTVYTSPCRKMGGQGTIGCAFSPLERLVAPTVLGKQRVGQQRGKRGKKAREKTYHNKNKNKRSR